MEQNQVRLEVIKIVEKLTNIFQSTQFPNVEELKLEDLEPDKVNQLVITCFGWTNRAIRQGMLALLAKRNGFSAEASPLVRSCVEHAVGVHWLTKDGIKALNALNGALSQTASKLFNAQEGGWFFKSDEIQQYLDDLVTDDRTQDEKSSDNLIGFKHLTQYLGMGQEYQAWLISTTTCHPGYPSSKFYVKHDAHGSIQLMHSPIDSHIEIELQVAHAIFLAMYGYLRFIRNLDREIEVKKLEQELLELARNLE